MAEALNNFIRVALVDSYEITRSALKSLMESRGGVRVVAQASSLTEGLQATRSHDCDVVVTEAVVRDHHVIWLLERLQKIDQAPPVLVLTYRTEERLVLRTVQAGARGVLGKGASEDELFRALSEVAAGNSYMDPALVHMVLDELRHDGDGRSRGSRLNARERKILELAAEGFSNGRIAEQLNVSVSTTKSKFQSIYRKLGVSDRTHAVVRSIRDGLISVQGISVDGR